MLKLPPKDIKYILLLVVTLILWIITEVTTTPPLDWSVSLDHRDRQPFGTLLLSKLIPHIFPENGFELNQKTVREVIHDDQKPENLLIIANRINLEKPGLEALLQFIGDGGNALLAANFLDRDLLDTLDIQLKDTLSFPSLEEKDSIGLYLETRPSQVYYFDQHYFSSYFIKYPETKTTTLGSTSQSQTILLDYQFGAGKLILCSTPLVFTNYYLSRDPNQQLAAGMLSNLPEAPTVWTEYYQTGKFEQSTPLRYVLSQPPLQWAYFTGILLLILFVIFQAKRKQRIIPVVKPPANASLEFIEVMSGLYLKKSNHNLIAKQRLQYFNEFLKRTYSLDLYDKQELSIQLSQVKGWSNAESVSFEQKIKKIKENRVISDQELIEINQSINKVLVHGQ